MSYALQPYAIDLAQLRRAVGSGDAELTSALVARFGRELDGLDAIDDEAEPSAREALDQLIDGEATDGEANFRYGWCLELLCRHLGHRLSNRHWSQMQMGWFERVSALLPGGSGGPLWSRLVYGVPPVDLPAVDDFPMVGHLAADDVETLAERVRAGIEAAPDSEEREALDEVRRWLARASARGLGLVTFYG